MHLDPDRFAQIIHNLMYNSLKFTPEGGTLTLALEEHEEEVHLYIRDTGTGMTARQNYLGFGIVSIKRMKLEHSIRMR